MDHTHWVGMPIDSGDMDDQTIAKIAPTLLTKLLMSSGHPNHGLGAHIGQAAALIAKTLKSVKPDEPCAVTLDLNGACVCPDLARALLLWVVMGYAADNATKAMVWGDAQVLINRLLA